MADAQNERTTGRNRRRRRRRQGGKSEGRPQIERHQEQVQQPDPVAQTPSFETASAIEPLYTATDVRPEEIEAPTQRMEEYCIHHMAGFTEHEPMQTRAGMTTLRHLRVDRFGEASLYCDCLHDGPHEWPPSMQRIQTAIELDQFLADSTREA